MVTENHHTECNEARRFDMCGEHAAIFVRRLIMRTSLQARIYCKAGVDVISAFRSDYA